MFHSKSFVPWVRALLALLLVAGVSQAGHAQNPLPREVAQALAAAGVPASAVSVVVAPLTAAAAPSQAVTPGPALTVAPAAVAAPPPAAPRLSWRADVPMNPASVMKTVTTLAGLELLGPGFTWRNRIYVDGPVADGVLRGNLIVRGSGDPKLVRERIEALLAAIQAQGVREVRGDIVLDRSVFELPPHDPAQFDNEPLRPYNAAPDGLLLNFKSILYTFSPAPDGSHARVLSEPPIDGVAIPTEVPLTTVGRCGNWRARLRATLDEPQRVRFDGVFAAACGEKVWAVAYSDPASYAPRVLRAMWQAAGGRLSGQVREGRTPASARLLLEAPSLPLADIVSDINKFSNNVMAQQLLLTLSSAQARLGTPAERAGTASGAATPPTPGAATSAASATTTPPPGNFAASRALLQRWWASRLPGVPPPLLENGAGLSRQERISAQALTALLRYAAASAQAQVFVQSLSVAGVDGTLAPMAQHASASAAIGNAQLKTGSLDDVTALAGYLSARSGQRYSIVALVNHPNAPAARPALERLLDWAVREL